MFLFGLRTRFGFLFLYLTTLVCGGAGFREDFSGDPATRGWKVFGEPQLFRWDAPNRYMEITWDSSRPNSYFYHPLGTVLARSDDFQVSFELQLQTIVVGTAAGKPFTFEIAAGFSWLADATSPNFNRGTGSTSPNLVELDYFPDSGFGATIWPALVSSNSVFNYNGRGDYTLIELPTEVWLAVNLNYSASNQTLMTTVTLDGSPLASINQVTLATGFTDFRVDTFGVSSYSDAGSDGSLLAHGLLRNVTVTVPEAPIAALTGGFSNHLWQVHFMSRSKWIYTLQRTTVLGGWLAVSPSVLGTGGNMSLSDKEASGSGAQFYRVLAERP